MDSKIINLGKSIRNEIDHTMDCFNDRPHYVKTLKPILKHNTIEYTQLRNLVMDLCNCIAFTFISITYTR